MMKKTKCYKQIQRLLRTNAQSFRSFRRNILFHKRSFICFGLLISLCIAFMFTGFNLIKAFRKDAAASLLPFAKNTLYAQLTVSDTEENTSNIPSEETMRQFAASNSNYIHGILPFLSTDTELRYNRTRISVTAIGTSEQFPEMKDITLKEGRFFNSFDIEDNKKFIVTGSQVSAMRSTL